MSNETDSNGFKYGQSPEPNSTPETTENPYRGAIDEAKNTLGQVGLAAGYGDGNVPPGEDFAPEPGIHTEYVRNPAAEALGRCYEAAVAFSEGTVLPKAFIAKYNEILSSVTADKDLKERLDGLLVEYSYLGGKLMSVTSDADAETVFELDALSEFLNARLGRFPKEQRAARAKAQYTAMLSLAFGADMAGS